MDRLYIEAQVCVPVLLVNLHRMSCSGTCWPLVVLSFSVDMKAFHELLSINVSCLGKLVMVFCWVELDFFSLECNEVSSNEL